jgi:hypothetical protein
MDADAEEVVLQVENSAAIERSAYISALRIEWGGKGRVEYWETFLSATRGKARVAMRIAKARASALLMPLKTSS